MTHSHSAEPKKARLSDHASDKPGGRQQQPLGVGERRLDQPGRHGPVPLDRVQAIERAVEQLVQGVVARRHQAGRKQRRRSSGQTLCQPSSAGS